jgi:hypothetical protein
VLIAILGLLLGYYLAVERKRELDPSAGNEMMPPEYPIWDHPESEVVELSLRDETRNTVIRRENGDAPWRLVRPIENGADQSYVAYAVRRLAMLTASQVFSDTEALEDMAAYGLAPSRAQATVVLADGRELVIHVGDKTPDQTGAYIQTDGELGSVYVVNTLVRDYIMRMLAEPPIEPTPTTASE